MGAMNSSQIEIKCLANGMGPYMEIVNGRPGDILGHVRAIFSTAGIGLCPSALEFKNRIPI